MLRSVRTYLFIISALLLTASGSAQVNEIPFGETSVLRFSRDSLIIHRYTDTDNAYLDVLGSNSYDCAGKYKRSVPSILSSDTLKRSNYFSTIIRNSLDYSCTGDSLNGAFPLVRVPLPTSDETFAEIRINARKPYFNRSYFQSAVLSYTDDTIDIDTVYCNSAFVDIPQSEISANWSSYHGLLKSQQSGVWTYLTQGENFIALNIDSIGRIEKFYKSQGIGTLSKNRSGYRIYSIGSSNYSSEIAIARFRNDTILTLYDFLESTGQIITKKKLLKPTDLPNFWNCPQNGIEPVISGITFSSDDSLLYFIYTYHPTCDLLFKIETLYVLKVNDPDPPSTLKSISSRPINQILSRQGSRQFQMIIGPDNNIYFGQYGDSAIHRIKNINNYKSVSIDWDFKQLENDEIQLSTSIPLSFHKNAGFEAYTSCSSDTVFAVYLGSDDLDSIYYYWGDGDSTPLYPGEFFHAQRNPHVYDSSGSYTISQKAYYNSCGYTRTKERSVDYYKPPQSVGMSIRDSIYCDSVVLRLRDTITHAASAIIQWGDGAIDTLTIADSIVLAASHTYSIQDTFSIRYQLYGHSIAGLGSSPCSMVIDTSYVVRFHPYPSTVWQWDNARGYQESKPTYCLGDTATLSLQNDSFASYRWDSQTLAQSESLKIYVEQDSTLHLAAHTANGCIVLDTLHIASSRPPVLLHTLDSAYCSTILPIASEVIAQSVYQWDSIASLQVVNSGGIDSVAVVLADTGSYTLPIYATTQLGCEVRDTLYTKVHATPTLRLNNIPQACTGDSLLIDLMFAPFASETTIRWTIDNVLEQDIQLAKAVQSHTLSKVSILEEHNKVSTVVATSAEGCSDTLLTPLIVNPKALVAWSKDTFIQCENGLSELLAVEVSAYDTFSSAFFIDNILIENQLERGIDTLKYQYNQAAGTYTLLATSTTDKGCIDTTLATLTILPAPSVSLAAADVCEGDSIAIESQIEYTTTSGQFSLNFDGDITSYMLNDTTWVYDTLVAVGDYRAQAIFTDMVGCADTSAFVDIAVLPRPVADFKSNLLKSRNESIVYRFEDLSQNHSSFYIDFDNGNTVERTSFSTVENTYSDSGSYTIIFIASQQDLCFDTLSRIIRVIPAIQFYIPTAITPNNDGLNDYLGIVPKEYIATLDLSLYNRWGEKIIEIQSLNDLPLTKDLEQGNYLLTGWFRDINGNFHPISQNLYIAK